VTIKEFKKILDEYPEHLEILQDRHSDYALIIKEDLNIVRAVPVKSCKWTYKGQHYLMAMTEDDYRLNKYYEQIGSVRDYLHIGWRSVV
jgi:hypothetical protein